MIRILLSGLQEIQAECYLRSVSSELDPLTAVSKELEAAAGTGG